MVWKRDLRRRDALMIFPPPTPAPLVRTLGWMTGYHCSTNWRPVMLEMGMLTSPKYVLFS